MIRPEERRPDLPRRAALTKAESNILGAMRRLEEPASLRVIAAAVERTPDTTRWLLTCLVTAGRVEQSLSTDRLETIWRLIPLAEWQAKAVGVLP